MEIKESTSNHITVLAIIGRLDGLTSQELEPRIAAFLAAEKKHLVFDCSELTYVSSAGLRVFLSGAKKIQIASGKLAFSSLQPSILEVFQLSGFTTLFAIHEDTAAAIASLN